MHGRVGPCQSVQAPVAKVIRLVNFYEAVYALVRDIPRGRVMTYGQVATILGHPRAARAVGYALRASKDSDIPWQRVINSKGGISARSEVDRPLEQRLRLEDEGIQFGTNETCDLDTYRWEPPNPESYIFITRSELPFA